MIQKPQLNGSTDPDFRLNLKQLELNALLEITEAINANLPETALYRIYHFTLLSNLTISKLALFVKDENWDCKVQYGLKSNLSSECIQKHIPDCDKIISTEGYDTFSEYDVIIPIAHKSKKLAYVFLGGISELNLSADDGDSPFSFVQTLTSILIVAVENKKLARKQLEQEAFNKELEIASQVQSNLFPSSLPSNEFIELRASYLPHLMVGGDYYDYVPLADNKFLFCIADVSGKGIPAALLMSSFQSGLRTLVRRTSDLEDIVRELNVLVKNNSHGDRFITFFCAIVDLNNYTLTYINAGHNPPFYIQNNIVMELTTGSTVLGIFNDLPFIEQETIEISSTGVLFAYTDGLTEAENEESDEYGTERLKDFLLSGDACGEFMHAGLLNELNTFKGRNSFPDDITIFSCCFR
jgi:sigma-B regulation protein RsbU (phosphoserine phosphatase)